MLNDRSWLALDQSESRLQHTVHVSGFIGDAGEAQDGVGFAVLSVYLRGGDVEPMLQAVQEALDHAALIFERDAVGDEELDAECAHDHGGSLTCGPCRGLSGDWLAADFLDDEGLKGIPFLEVIEVLQRHTALEAGFHLGDVVLEASQ